MVDADPSVTLEDDLQRRDFTINAIARGADGQLVDPCGGAADLATCVLRQIGPAFAEDPLRILRAGRFMARFAPLGFTVAPETMALMRTMVASGELDTLVPERIWQELRKALASPQPSAFLATLRACGALAAILPEGVVAITLAPGETNAPAYRLTYEGAMTVGPDLPMPVGKARIGLTGIDAIGEALLSDKDRVAPALAQAEVFD